MLEDELEILKEKTKELGAVNHCVQSTRRTYGPPTEWFVCVQFDSMGKKAQWGLGPTLDSAIDDLLSGEHKSV